MGPLRAAAVTLVGVSACASSGLGTTTATITTTTTTAPVFRARVEPSAARAGTRITVTPAGEVQPLCLGAAVVFAPSASGIEPIGMLSVDGDTWQDGRNGATTSLAACQPPRSASSSSYVVPP